MKIHEYIAENQGVVNDLIQKGITTKDLQNAPVFRTYEEYIKKRGLPATQSATATAERYNVTLRTVWNIIKRMNTEI